MFKHLSEEKVDWKNSQVRRGPGGEYMVIIKLQGVPIYYSSFSPIDAFELLANSVDAIQTTAKYCQKEYKNGGL